MPRGPRLDTPGTLHHVIIRGIGQGRIVSNDDDRNAFVNRMGTVAEKTGTTIYAWVLLDNHAHLLLQSGQTGLPTYMRKLLSWYAQYYNRRHNRSGHLFQNRYKSIICEADAYFQKLVAYIHLNPFRAGLVNTLDELDSYPWSGHAAIVGKARREWQKVDVVLRNFGDRVGTARRAYLNYLEEEAGKGKQPELVGGGLVRSQGGWSVVKSLRKKGKQAQGDERILGSSKFVKTILDEAEEQVRLQIAGGEKRELVERDIKQACAEAGLSQNEFRSGSRMKPLSEIRNKLAVRFVREYGLSLAETARQLGVTTSAVYQIMQKQASR